jgi:uncharacterized protein
MNRLQNAKSPYLLQHQSNPVDWYPWSEDAFRAAKDRDVPIFLSIGYATCHWCHVMERESFENQAVADLMNRHFVCVKVDREERPDIDDVYMTVCHLMGHQGGWPLTVLLTPERKPFYVGTYLPRSSRFGRIGMMELIPKVGALWTSSRSQILRSADDIVSHLNTTSPAGSSHPGVLEKGWIEAAYRHLADQFDGTYGGFGAAPKFPSPHNLRFLYAYGQVFREPRAEKMATDTILGMWRGGVFDQVGYGFHRYSTDVEWRLPHFEKMLHDQALMLHACIDGWLATKDSRLRSAALETAEYVLRDLAHPDGGFYSAEDADSEGEEGRFYVWTEAEFAQVLPEADAALARDWFGTRPEGNFADEASGMRAGTNILHPGGLKGIAAADRKRLAALLLHRREARVRPLRDEKILLDWNGLMIGALSRAGRYLGDARLLDSASQAHIFLRDRLSRGGVWFHRWFRDDADVPAMLDDYAYLGSGLIDLFLATSNPAALRDSIDLAEAMIQFCDAEDGGFFRSSSAGEALLVRKQDWYDGATPAGVSAALDVLLRLDALTGDSRFAERAAVLIGASERVLSVSPGALTGFLTAGVPVWPVGGLQGSGATQVVVVSSRPDDALMREALTAPLAGGFVLWLPAEGEVREALLDLIPALKDMHLLSGSSAAYVCRGYQCDAPVTDLESLRAALRGAEAKS